MKHLVIAALLVACSAPARSPAPAPVVEDPGAVQDPPSVAPTPPPPPEGSTGAEGPPAPGSLADGDRCLTSSACQSGVCEGEGCGDTAPGTCVPRSRACTRDLRPYCGCDGTTFRTSGSCPGQRFASRGECTAP